MSHDRIILSAKVSGGAGPRRGVSLLAARCDYPLHLGLTEAGMGTKEHRRASAAGLGILLQEGIGDTIRVSLTPAPGGDRTEEVLVAQQILQSLRLAHFTPQVTSCPGVRSYDQHLFPARWRSRSKTYLREKMPVWRAEYPGVEEMRVAVDGMRRQRSRRVEACQHRHLAPRHLRGTEGTSLPSMAGSMSR